MGFPANADTEQGKIGFPSRITVFYKTVLIICVTLGPCADMVFIPPVMFYGRAQCYRVYTGGKQSPEEARNTCTIRYKSFWHNILHTFTCLERPWLFKNKNPSMLHVFHNLDNRGKNFYFFGHIWNPIRLIEGLQLI